MDGARGRLVQMTWPCNMMISAHGFFWLDIIWTRFFPSGSYQSDQQDWVPSDRLIPAGFYCPLKMLWDGFHIPQSFSTMGVWYELLFSAHKTTWCNHQEALWQESYVRLRDWAKWSLMRNIHLLWWNEQSGEGNNPHCGVQFFHLFCTHRALMERCKLCVWDEN